MHMTESIERHPGTAHSARVRNGPALIVVGIVAVVALGGALLALLPGTSPPPPRAVGSHASYGGIGAASANGVLAHVQTDGVIPSGVVSSLVIPLGAHYLGSKDFDNGNGPFDREVDLMAPYAQRPLVTFFKDALKADGWQIDGTEPTGGPTGNGTETLAQRPGSNGYYWEVGVTVTGGTDTVSPALGGGSATSGTSEIKVRLLEVPDAN